MIRVRVRHGRNRGSRLKGSIWRKRVLRQNDDRSNVAFVLINPAIVSSQFFSISPSNSLRS